ncbi:hypothetical protein [Paenibacillus sp. MBLB4367]|uniref:hypothetical protein n=1 Tax=Paenibacillus sp. MBLB4367 TaxID=3384767 RepID=UPI003907F5C8
MKRKWFTIIVAVLAIACLSAVFIKVQASPPSDTRVIVERTHQTYIAPMCFEKAETTNNLTEATYALAKELGYKPESSCTENALKPQTERLITVIAQKVNLAKSKWDW